MSLQTRRKTRRKTRSKYNKKSGTRRAQRGGDISGLRISPDAVLSNPVLVDKSAGGGGD
jgi:hypothetical protein